MSPLILAIGGALLAGAALRRLSRYFADLPKPDEWTSRYGRLTKSELADLRRRHP